MIEFEKYIDKEITISGFAEKVRNIKWVQFIVLRNGTQRVQITIEKSEEKNAEMVKKVEGLTNESTIKVTGKLVKNENVKMGGMEIIPTSLEITSLAAPELPISITNKDAAQIDTRMDNRFIDLRNDYNMNIFKIQSEFVRAMRKYLYDNDFTEIHTPKLIGAASESGSEVFEVDYFGNKAYLAQSPQFYKQMAMASGFGRVFEVAPCFRAENSNTKTHASEFWMIEPEVAFCDLEEDMNIMEDMLKYVVKYVLDNCPEEMEFFNKYVEKGLIEKLTKLVNSKFVRIDHKDVIKILKEAKVNWEFEPEYGEDIAREHEKYITEYFDGPVFIKNWPKDIKAFYMKQNKDGKTVAAVDLEVPGAGELMGGSQREEDYDKLINRMKEMHMEEEGMEWYLNLRKYGGCIHSGFGMGFERLIIYLTGVDNIRDVIPYPRTPGNCDY